MTLTPEQIAAGWKLHDGSDVCPIKDDRTRHEVMVLDGTIKSDDEPAENWWWEAIRAYRIIEAHGADAEPVRPTPWPHDYSELVWDADGWSQTIIVDGKRPEWLRDDDRWNLFVDADMDWSGREFCDQIAIRVRRREPKRETQRACLRYQTDRPFDTDLYVTIDLIDGKPDLSTLKIAEDAL